MSVLYTRDYPILHLDTNLVNKQLFSFIGVSIMNLIETLK